MGKISPVAAKYIVHATISIEGVVDKPDVIGAIFGQTEGLLGADLELRELQRSGKIGRIEVNLDIRSGKTVGEIILPSSLDKAETSIVGAALEIIQRIGPCNAKIKVDKIEDVRISKREFVIERAKELLRNLMDQVMPDSQELADEVAYSVRVMEITEYGRERLPAGPSIDDSDELIVVEGRADVLNLLKHGFKNVIALNGTSVPQTIIELSKKKTLTAFVDGDRGGNLILQELYNVSEIDFVAKAPDGKEVEEITKKEIHKALRSRIASEQAKLEFSLSIPNPQKRPDARPEQRTEQRTEVKPEQRVEQKQDAKFDPKQQKKPVPVQTSVKKKQLKEEEFDLFRDMLEDLIGTRGAYILDEKFNILGKLPVTELESTLKSMTSGIFAVVFDGVATKELLTAAESANVSYLVAMSTKVTSSPKTGILTGDDL
ncbi:DNA primase [Candidatus Woesearchaeota archaeon]|nr:MAG: DNA primase [Candidatus Woesearchaeota archaeon]